MKDFAWIREIVLEIVYQRMGSDCLKDLISSEFYTDSEEKVICAIAYYSGDFYKEFKIGLNSHLLSKGTKAIRKAVEMKCDIEFRDK